MTIILTLLVLFIFYIMYELNRHSPENRTKLLHKIEAEIALKADQDIDSNESAAKAIAKLKADGIIK